MRPSSGLRRFFRIASVRPDPVRDLDEELRFHFDRTVEELMRVGLTEGEAREEAHRRFGDLDRYRAELEEMGRGRVRRERRFELGLALRTNLRQAIRGLRRSPVFAAGVVLTLALGIGANATMFGVIDRLLLRAPPHIEDPQDVRKLFVERVGFADRTVTSSYIAYPDYMDWTSSEAFEAEAAYGATLMIVGHGESAERVRSELVTGTYFELLGVNPQLGRLIDASDDRPGATGVAVLSYGFWRRRFGGDPSVIGHSIDLDRGRFTVVGVAPRGFNGADLNPVDVWIPIYATTNEFGYSGWEHNRNEYWIQTIGRLAAGVSVEGAENEATRLHRAGRQESVASGQYDPKARVIAAPVIAAQGPGAPAESEVARWLAAVALVVLIIACANVANLLLARGANRRREIAVRLAMGISRTRLTGLLLTESLILAALGGVAALLLAHWGGGLIVALLLPGVAWPGSPVDGRMLLFTGIVVLVTGLASGLAPVLQARRHDVTADLKSGARAGTRRRSRARSVLSVAQAALSVVLLVGAGLFVRSLSRVSSLDLGFEPEGLSVVRLELEGGERDAATVSEIYGKALSRLQTRPGVARAAAGISIPFWSSQGNPIAVPGIDSLPLPPSGGPYRNSVTEEYFATLGIAITKGRGFVAGDYATGAAPVVVLEEDMARGIWPGEDPLGKCIYPLAGESSCARVVGVVESSRRQAVLEQEQWIYYQPLPQDVYETPPRAIFVRSSREWLLPQLGRELQEVLPEVRYAVVVPLTALIEPDLRSWRLGAAMFTIFGGLALTVAAVGLFAVLSFNVARRRHEIGVRSALGATRGRIVALVMREAGLLTTIGIGLGLLVAAAAADAIAPLLYRTSPRDPMVLAVVALTLLLVGLAAAAFPAWRAARLDPNSTLRAE